MKAQPVQARRTITVVHAMRGIPLGVFMLTDAHAADDGHARLVKDFVKVWHTVMMLGWFDVTAEHESAVAF